MTYRKIVIKRSKKPTVWDVTFEGNSQPGWETSGTLGHLHEVDGYFVMMQFLPSPVAVRSSLQLMVECIKKRTRCENVFLA